MTHINIPAHILDLEIESAKCHRFANNAREGGDKRGAREMSKRSRDLYRAYRQQLDEWFNTVRADL